MRRYISLDEYDGLYNKLPEEVAFILYGDAIPNAVQIIQKRHALHLDVLGPINTLIIDTLLGLCPAAEFESEIIKIGIEAGKAAEITTYVNAEIFSQIQTYFIGQYTDKNQESESSFEEVELDQYRESVPIIPGRGPIIESEHLEASKEHILDEMFAAHTPKIKELTPEDGAIIKPLDETPQHSDLLTSVEVTKKEPEAIQEEIPNPSGWSKFRDKLLSRRKSASSEVGDEERLIEENLENIDKPEINTTIPVQTKKVTIVVSKTASEKQPAEKEQKKVVLVVSKKTSQQASPKQTVSSGAAQTPTYNVDPYREIL